VRRLTLSLIALGVLVFAVISAVLARAFSIDGAERAAITRLVQDEAGGHSGAMVALITDCAPSSFCRSRVAADAAALRRTGRVSILELNPSAGFSLGSTLGTARVAWRAGSHLPVVQCVRVRRAGNVISGLSVHLLEISQRIKSGANCPKQF
jgi:hypothetical protein